MKLAPPRRLDELAEYAGREIQARLAELGSPDLDFRVEVFGDGGTRIESIASVDSLEPGCLAFATSRAYLDRVEASEAAAVILPPSMTSAAKAYLQAPAPRLVFSIILELGLALPSLVPARAEGVRFKDRDRVELGCDVIIGDWCYVGADVKIGDGCRIYPQVFIDDRVTIGEGCVVYPRVTLFRNTTLGRKVIIHSGVVIGDEGFGFNQIPDPGRGRLHHLKNEHIGGVIVGDHAEIGSQVCIDRGMIGNTIIGAGTKIDNHVQIGHNARLGRDCILAGQVGMAGSSSLGDRVLFLGGAGIVNNVSVGDDAFVSARTTVTSDLPAGAIRWAGTPAQEADREWKLIALARRELPRLRDLFRSLKKADSFDEFKSKLFEKPDKGAP